MIISRAKLRSIGAWRDILRHLPHDRSGLALLEFAFTLPLVLAVGGWGAELSFLAITNMRISQYALNLADTVSRIGVDAGAGVTSLREADINDALQGVRISGKGINIGTFGRVTLSSLENTKQSYDTDYVQRIHWQRCFGLKNGGAYSPSSSTGFTSSYGTTSTTAGTTNQQADAGTPTPAGMGDANNKVLAPKDNAVMFVEINYLYQPLFGTLFMGSTPRIIHYTASLLVRDNRDYTQVSNPTTNPVTPRSTCDKYTV